MIFKLKRVKYMPEVIEPGVLYFAEEFGAAAHLCACGCGTKVRTPIAVTEWSIGDEPGGVSLTPSVGNWQHPCRSHYWITDGEVIWCGQWSDDEILMGRQHEADRREQHYLNSPVAAPTAGFFRRLWRRMFQ